MTPIEMRTRGVEVALVLLAYALGGCADTDGLAGAGQDDDEPVAAAPKQGRGGDKTSKPGPSGTPESTCEAGKTSCDDVCIDLSSDPESCGRCGHGCLGGVCEAGVCQPVTLATDLAIPQGLAIGPDGVYVTLSGGNSVVRIPKDGGTPAVVSNDTQSPWGIAVAIDGDKTTRVIWGENRGTSSNIVFHDPVASTTKKTLVGSDVWQVAITGTLAFWATSSSSAGSVQRCPITGCSGSPFAVIPSAPKVFGLIATGGQVAFGLRDSSGLVRRASTGGNGVTTLISAIDSPKGLATDGANVYAAVSGSNVIARCPLTGCALGQQNAIAIADNPHSVASDGKNVYWTNGKADGGSISWCPAGSCSGSGQVLAAKQKNPYTIAVDDEAVYWTNAAPKGQVMKVARP